VGRRRAAILDMIHKVRGRLVLLVDFDGTYCSGLVGPWRMDMCEECKRSALSRGLILDKLPLSVEVGIFILIIVPEPRSKIQHFGTGTPPMC
jgi:ABC-type microcin C transport system permease subunit YejB